MPHEIAPINGIPRYSILEIERRWLVDPLEIGNLDNASYRLYEDLYIAESRLRLRKITEPGGNVLYKLGKKYGKRTELSEPITTLYLTESEYLQFSQLRGYRSIKRRHSVAGGFVDVYQLPRTAPMIFELEFKDEMEAERYTPPSFVTKEITGDPNFSGFQLAKEQAT